MLIVQILREQPTSPRKLNNRIPVDVDTICLKCLEKDPDRRYQTAAELGQELRRYLSGKPILARPVGAMGRLWRWYRCNPEATARVAGGYAIACAVVLIIWGLAGLFVYAVGIDRSSDAGRAMVEVTGMIACVYLPLLWGGIQVLNNHIRFLWMNLTFFVLGLSLATSGLLGVIVFSGVFSDPRLNIALLVLLADITFLGALIHAVAVYREWFGR